MPPAAATALGGLPRARAQGGQVIRIGVITDMSGPYRDTTGPGSVALTQQAVQDFGSRGFQVEVLQADHQNKPDVGANIARQWFDQGVDAVVDLPTSSVALAVNQIAREKNKVHLNSGAATSRPDRRAVQPEHGALDLRHLHAGEVDRRGDASRPAATAGSSSPPTTPSAMRWNATPANFVKAQGGKVVGASALSLPGDHRLLRLPAAGAGEPGQGARPRQCLDRYGELHQGGAGIRPARAR